MWLKYSALLTGMEWTDDPRAPEKQTNEAICPGIGQIASFAQNMKLAAAVLTRGRLSAVDHLFNHASAQLAQPAERGLYVVLESGIQPVDEQAEAVALIGKDDDAAIARTDMAFAEGGVQIGFHDVCWQSCIR